MKNYFDDITSSCFHDPVTSIKRYVFLATQLNLQFYYVISRIIVNPPLRQSSVLDQRTLNIAADGLNNHRINIRDKRNDALCVSSAGITI